MTITGNFGHFQYFNYETNFIKTKTKKLEYCFSEITTIEIGTFSLACQKLILIQIECVVQNRPMMESGQKLFYF